MFSSEKKDELTKTKDKTTKEIVKAAGMLFGNLESVRFDPEIDCPPRACYNCWDMNHYIRDCREPKLREYCCNCGRKDVQVDQCARCSKAFIELEINKKKWIYYKFLNYENKQEDESKKQTMRNDPEATVDWKESFYSFDVEHGECGTATQKNGKNNRKSDDDFGWKAYIEPNDLFAYMRAEKIKEELSSDEINNTAAVNLDETRMAERNSFGENSVISDELKKHADKKESSRMSGEQLDDYLILLNAIKHMSVDTQEVIVLQFMSERKKFNEMQRNSESKIQ